MAVRVDDLSSEVSVEPEPGSQQQAAEPRPWDRLAEWRGLRDRAAEDAARTRAEDFGD